MTITWDEKKRKQVIKDHGVDLAEIEDIFNDPFAVYLEDFAHSTEEEIRLKIIGLCAGYGLIFAVYVFDENDDVRMITVSASRSLDGNSL